MDNDQDQLRVNDIHVTNLARLVTDLEFDLAKSPEALKHVLTNGCWKERKILGGELVKFKTFQEFLETKPLRGIGVSQAVIEKIASLDQETYALLQVALCRPRGGANNPLGISGYTDTKPCCEDSVSEASERAVNGNNVTIDGSSSKPEGNSAGRSIRFLNKNDPELYAKVLAGELTPHGAMVQGGYRTKTITVQLNPTSAACTLKKHFSKEQIAEIVKFLQSEIQEPEFLRRTRSRSKT